MQEQDALLTEQVLSRQLFLQREETIGHLAYGRELTFYEAVKNGDTKKLKEIMLPLKNEKLGKLSQNPIRNMKYHLIITIALITRFCMEGGMPPETAYTLSDVYIQKLDLLDSEDSITELHRKVIFDFASRMKKLRKETILSLPIIKSIDYIHDHLQEKISLEDVAMHLDMNKSYLSKLFKKQVGVTMGSYITKLKIEAAANMLIYEEHSPVDISNYFSFSSHSYFINTFKKETGMTPTEYRKRYYRKHFEPQK